MLIDECRRCKLQKFTKGAIHWEPKRPSPAMETGIPHHPSFISVWRLLSLKSRIMAPNFSVFRYNFLYLTPLHLKRWATWVRLKSLGCMCGCDTHATHSLLHLPSGWVLKVSLYGARIARGEKCEVAWKGIRLSSCSHSFTESNSEGSLLGGYRGQPPWWLLHRSFHRQ